MGRQFLSELLEREPTSSDMRGLWPPGLSGAWALLNGHDGISAELDLGVGWQDPAVIAETGWCVWRSGPQPELELKTDGALLGKMQPERRDAFLKAFDPKSRVVVFGHSHQPCLLTLGHMLFFNPGSAGHKRFSLPRSLGVLEIFPRGVRGAILSLERYNEKLPAKVWLPVAEA